MKNILLATSLSFFLIACSDTKIPSENHPHDGVENRQNLQHKNEEHGHNHANQHMHNTPVAELIEAFESGDREKTQKPMEVIGLLGNIEGKKILDIGAGSGYFSFRMANLGADVLAGDVNDDFLDYILKKTKKTERNKGSVTPKKLPFDSPDLSENEIDHAIIVNTYHHIENRPNYFKKVLDGLKTEGKLMVVDFKKQHFEEKVEGPPYDMRIASEVVIQELTDAGFTKFETNTSLLPYQYVVVAWKPESTSPNKTPKNSAVKEDFKSLSVDKINQKLTNYRHEFSPEDIMREYYPVQINTAEGKEKITISSKNISKDIAVVTLIHDNLLDDSMRGKKLVMELHKKGRKWFVYSIKKNWRCYRGHDFWGIDNCK